MMKVLFDPQIFNDQFYGGISRYYSEIYNQIKNQNLTILELPIFYSENIHLNEKKILNEKLNSIEKFCIKNNFFKRKIIRRLKRKNLKYTNLTLSKQDFDVLVPTYYNPYFLENIGNKPFVLTVYDMIHEIFPHYFGENDKISEWKKILFPKATKIIAVSQNTKKDILKFFPEINPDKIHVIYHGYSEMEDKSTNIKLPEKYILYVGNRENYKNFIFFAKSIENLLKKEKDLNVFCAGGTPFYDEEINLFESMGLKERFIQYRFQDYELAQIYQKALCFVFPSMYEGFGIPVLEAMANSCPIILAKHSSFPEVAGDAGIYFDLNDSEDLATNIEKTINDKDFRNEIIEKGIENVKRFTWENAANECFKVYQLAKTNV